MDILAQAVRTASPWRRGRAMWGELKHRLATAREDARVRGDLEYELACLDQAGELDGVLEGIGLSRAALPIVIKNYPGSMRRFLGMTRRLRIGAQPAPTLRVGIDALFGPRRRCLFCAESRRCESWLRTGRGESYGAFCPNAPVFDRMRKSS